jgi:hypothetical protein
VDQVDHLDAPRPRRPCHHRLGGGRDAGIGGIPVIALTQNSRLLPRGSERPGAARATLESSQCPSPPRPGRSCHHRTYGWQARRGAKRDMSVAETTVAPPDTGIPVTTILVMAVMPGLGEGIGRFPDPQFAPLAMGGRLSGSIPGLELRLGRHTVGHRWFKSRAFASCDNHCVRT